MKKKSFIALACGAMLLAGINACKPVETDVTKDFEVIDDADLSNNEIIFKRAIVNYTGNTIFPTYEGMANGAIKLADQMALVLKAAQNGDNENTALIEKAGEYWTEARKYWELSEAFLYGPAGDYDIDPHIDSWPFDQAAFDDLINNADMMNTYTDKLESGASLEEEEYGLMGFHALEYVLFALSEDGQTSLAHKVGDFSVAQWTYMTVVANDLRNQSVLLEAAWRGMERVSSAKQGYLKAAGMTEGKFPYLSNGYAQYMLAPGIGDVIYHSYQEAAEELIAGAIDIADEVGNSKIGAAANATPGSANYQEDHDNIESPYSLHSIIDFQNNIRSIQNAFFGSGKNDNSVNDFVSQKNKGVSEAVKTSAEAAIEAIGKIQEPFVEHAKDAEAKSAIEVVNTLLDNLTKAWEVVAGQQWVDEDEE